MRTSYQVAGHQNEAFEPEDKQRRSPTHSEDTQSSAVTASSYASTRECELQEASIELGTLERHLAAGSKEARASSRSKLEARKTKAEQHFEIS